MRVGRVGEPLAWMGRGRRGGFSLVEMMSALIVLVVGVFAVFSLIAVSVRADMETAHYAAAKTLAQTTMEQMRASTTRPTSGTISGVTSTLGSGATGTISVTPHESTGQTALDLVAITLTWSEPGRGTASYRLDTYICSGGVGTN